jgi:hypothetical protein
MKGLLMYATSMITVMVCLIGLQCAAGSRPMSADDENLQATWDWTQNAQYTLYSSDGGGSISRHASTLPYFTAGNSLLNLDKPDMHTQDGWVLVHRDFGTPSAAQPFPFFTLYNKYRGIFRVMLYNATQREGSYFLGELSLVDGTSAPLRGTALFTFADPNEFNCSLNNYNPKVTLTAMSKMTAYASWAVFDYALLGYDPSLPKNDPVIGFKLTSIEKKAINLKTAGAIQLFQTVENTGMATPCYTMSTSDVLGIATKGYSAYKSVGLFMENEILSDAAQAKHKDKEWFKVATSLAASKVGSFIPYAAAIGSVLECFVGGANTATEWAPLNFTGQLSLDTEGAVHTKRELWNHNFYLNVGDRNDLRAQRPVQAIPWGIFNLAEMPSLEEPVTAADTMTIKVNKRPEIVLNPGMGMDLVSIKVAFINNNILNAEEDTSQASVTPFMTIEQAMASGFSLHRSSGTTTTFSHGASEQPHSANTAKTAGVFHAMGLLWELKLKTKEPTLYNDNEILIYKKTGHRGREAMLKGLKDIAGGNFAFPADFKISI